MGLQDHYVYFPSKYINFKQKCGNRYKLSFENFKIKRAISNT